MKSAPKRTYPVHRIVKVNPLTDSRLRVLCAVANYIAEHRYAPTMRELCDITGFKSSSNIFAHITVLEQAGYLHIPHDESGARRTRTMKLTKIGMEQVNVTL